MVGSERLVVAGAIRLIDEGTRYDIIKSIPHPDFRDYPLLWNELVNNLIYPLLKTFINFLSIALDCFRLIDELFIHDSFNQFQ